MKLPARTITVPAPGGSPLCPWCREHKVGEPHSFALINGGALLRGQDGSATISDTLSGFLILRWHGAHLEDGGTGPFPDSCAMVDVADDTPSGQFEFLFCSTSCLRAFLNHLVDRLENDMQAAAPSE